MYLIRASGVFLASILFSLCLTSIINYTINSADALEAKLDTEIKAKIGSETETNKTSSSDQASVNATAKTTVKASEEASVKASEGTTVKASEKTTAEDSEDTSLKAESKTTSTIKSSYQKITLNSKNSFAVNTERHLYKPGEEVQVSGAIRSNLISQLGGVGVVKVQVVDNKGTVVYDDSVSVRNDGTYSAKFALPVDSQKGAYTIKSNIEANADVASTLTIDTQSHLQTSAKFVVANGNAFVVKAKGNTFNVNIASNSNIDNFEFKQDEKKVTFTVEGESGTQGVTEVTIPKAMLSGQMSVMIDGQVAAPDDVIISSDTDAETTLEINYHHSMHTIDITGASVVPEFPNSMIIVMAIGSVAAVLLARTRILHAQKI